MAGKKGGGGITGKTGLKSGRAVKRVRMLDGEKVRATKYWGKNVGHGNYMAGYISEGQLICDSAGKPIPYKQIGKLV